MLTLARLLVVVAFVLPSVAATVQSRADFSGTWTRVTPPLGADETYVEHVDLRDSTLKVSIKRTGSGGIGGWGYSDDHTYSIGASATTTKAEDGTIRSVAVAWDGPSLLFVRTTQEGANTTTTREVWSVSGDGTKLTKSSETTSWRGTSRDTRVFERR